MTMEDEKKDTLIRYRLEQAKEAIDDAGFLFDNNRGLRSVVQIFPKIFLVSKYILMVISPCQNMI